MMYMQPTLVEMTPVEDCQLATEYVVWYVVAIAILGSLAVALTAACVLYCIARGRKFAGSFQTIKNKKGQTYQVKLGCK